MINLGNKFLRAAEAFIDKLRILKRKAGEYYNIYKKREIISSVKLTKEQKEQIDFLWKENYGKKIPYFWHRLYTAYTGKFDPKYFPEIIYSTKIESNYNDKCFAIAYEDKAQLDIVLNDGTVNTVKTIVGRSNGSYFDEKHQLIGFERVKAILLNVGKVVLKPSHDTDSGRGVEIFNFIDGFDIKTGKELSEIIETANEDFIIQEFITPHKSMSTLYGNCINTIRIITYILGGKVYHAPVSMRIGSGNAVVDNIHAGGYVIAVDDNGYLGKYAFKEFGERTEVHPDSKVKFEGYQISSIPEALEKVKSLHSRIPRLMFISWDVTINENGIPIILEMNTRNQSVWFPQMTNGKSIFGENTEKMIRLCKNKKKRSG